MALLRLWKRKSKRTKPTDFIFSTRCGNPENSKNILRRHVYSACDTLELRRANWLTFRRTFSTWSHKNGIPPKDLAELMGHADVDMQFEYTIGTDENKHAAAAKLGKELVTLDAFIRLLRSKIEGSGQSKLGTRCSVSFK